MATGLHPENSAIMTTKMKFYRIHFTDTLNQVAHGGLYLSMGLALYTARGIVRAGFKTSWKIVRESDGIVLAQSKATQS